MLRFATLFTLIGFLSACTPGSKSPVTQSLPPATEPKPEAPAEEKPFTSNMAHVTLKGYAQAKATGLVHLVQENNQIKGEIMMEGLRPGPYTIAVMDNAKCMDLRIKDKKMLGQFVADSKGNIKASFEMNRMSIKDLLQKKIVLFSKVQNKKEVDACGIPEVVENQGR